MFILVIPSRASEINIPWNAKWKRNGIIVAGGNGRGIEPDQLFGVRGLYVDDYQTIYTTEDFTIIANGVSKVVKKVYYINK